MCSESDFEGSLKLLARYKLEHLPAELNRQK